MRKFVLATAILGCATITGAAFAQTAPPAGTPPPSGPAAEAKRNYEGIKANILKSAEKMPEDGYSFKPKPDVRVYARILNHVTEAQFRSCAVVNGAKEFQKPPADTADKATIIAALKASFDECDKAYAALTDANIGDMLTAGQAKRSRIGLLWGTNSHDNEQYSQLALYLRLKDIAPPSAEK